jgi:hypothetical protein
MTSLERGMGGGLESGAGAIGLNKAHDFHG